MASLFKSLPKIQYGARPATSPGWIIVKTKLRKNKDIIFIDFVGRKDNVNRITFYRLSIIHKVIKNLLDGVSDNA